MKSLIAELEAMSKKVVSEIGQISQEVAQKLEVILTQALANVKAKISSLLRSFVAKVRSLGQKRISTDAGPSATSFPQRVESALKSAETEAGKLLHDAKTEAVDMMQEAKGTIERLSASLNAARGDVTEDIRKAGQDVYQSLVKVGEGAVGKVESFVDNTLKDIEIDGSFVAKHSLAIGEAAVISAINPVLMGCLAASAAIIVVAHGHAESVRKRP